MECSRQCGDITTYCSPHWIWRYRNSRSSAAILPVRLVLSSRVIRQGRGESPARSEPPHATFPKGPGASTESGHPGSSGAVVAEELAERGEGADVLLPAGL